MYTQELLQQHDIRPTYQRVRIYNTLIYGGHLTVQEIYQELINEMPTLSISTIYNTLYLLSEKDLVDAIPIEGHEFRFSLHSDTAYAHFRCCRCGKIENIDKELSAWLSANRRGYRPEIWVTTLCEECSDK